ncbi:MAG: 2-C-methyl-D-erythritol 2,4-cyclodiphosphate synthase [Fibrobacteria bacterium]|nr:2-C-methyl-D-erythritol 2,4-cyclodiphosphate synthase [Fibrobacteria bacterium]
MIKVGIGQDSHRLSEGNDKPLIMGGVVFGADYHLEGNSDADVVLHAITNAVSGVTGYPVLGEKTDELCRQGVKDSSMYLRHALSELDEMQYAVTHLSLSIECLRPKISPHIQDMKKEIAGICSITMQDVAITATSGEGLTDFGRGMGIQVFCVLTASRVEKTL